MTSVDDENEDSGYETDEYVRVVPDRARVFTTIVVIQAIAFAAAFLWGLMRHIHWWLSIRLDSTLIWGLVLGLMLAGANHLFFRTFRNCSFSHMNWVVKELMHPLFKEIKPLDILIFCTLSGFCEEALFRGIMQQEWGLIISNLVFGALHTGDRRLVFTGCLTTLLGFTLGFACSLTGNLAVPMLAHGINNLFGLVYIRYFYRPEC
jgi:uncharacterized protein